MDINVTSADLRTQTDNDTIGDLTTTQHNEVDDTAQDFLELYLQRYNHTSPLQHAVAVSFFFTFGLVGNSIVIHIYRQKAASSFGNLYFILLAAVDIFACCVTLPIMPFLKYLYHDPYLIILRKVFFLSSNFQTINRLSITICMAE